MANNDCPLGTECAFMPVWESIQAAISSIYRETTIQNLIDNEKKRARRRR
jgi:DNA-binding IscR family transcriptional regulator